MSAFHITNLLIIGGMKLEHATMDFTLATHVKVHIYVWLGPAPPTHICKS
jgi:hypothetical protein